MVGIAVGVGGDVVAGHVRDVGSVSMSSLNFLDFIFTYYTDHFFFYILDHCLIWTCLYFGLISDFLTISYQLG